MESKIFITSDLHLCHDRDFIYGPRGFKSIAEHDETIVKNWNSIVTPLDEVYVLGDLMLNDDVKGMKLLKQLNGIITVIAGNHDTTTRLNNYYDSYNVAEICYGLPFRYKNYHFFLSHYPTLCGNNDGDKPLKRRVINLCGHTHYKNRYKDMDKGLIYHVEMDAHNCYPVPIEQIIEDIKTFTSLDKNAQKSLCESDI